MLRTGTGVAVLAVIGSIAVTGSVSATPDRQDRDSVANVDAELETRAVFDDEAGGYADTDDPAIWVDRDHPRRSLVIVTEKEAGLVVFDRAGQVLQEIDAPAPPSQGDAPGRLNNVDLVYDVPLGADEEPTDLAVVSDRGLDQIRIYAIDDDGAADGGAPLRDVTASDVPYVFSADQDEVNSEATAYGLAAWQDGDDAYAAVSRNNDTALAQVRLEPTDSGKVTYRVVDRVNLPSTFELPDGTMWSPCGDPGELPQVEGMVVDRDRDVLYAAQETVGIWRIPFDDNEFATPRMVDKVREYGVPATYDAPTDECIIDDENDPGFGGEHIAGDAEGLTIYDSGHGKGYLLASSQGDDTFAVYKRRRSNSYVGSFHVADSAATDGVQETDGLDVTSADLGGRFDDGLLVVQDGHNTPEVTDGSGDERDNSNVKFVSWTAVARGLDLSRHHRCRHHRHDRHHRHHHFEEHAR